MPNVKICCECGCNHMGSLEIAKKMIREAKVCGCDYVKFQKRHLGSIPKKVAERPYVSEHSFGATYLDHRLALEFDGQQWRELQVYAEKQEIGFFGTAFDLESAMFLCSLGVPYLKIGSGQSRDHDLLKEINKISNIPLIISLGMCNEDDVEWIIKNIKFKILVQSTSSYPCPEEEVNLSFMNVIGGYYVCNDLDWRNLEHGLSGHYSAGNGAIEAAAVALRATYIERHFTLDRTWKGNDQAASLEPIGMMNVVKAIRTVERAMGTVDKKVMPSEVKLLEKLNAESKA